MQRFTGEIEGFYSGTPDAKGFGRLTAKSRHYRLELYRAVVRRIKLLEAVPAPDPATTAGMPMETPAAPVVSSTAVATEGRPLQETDVEPPAIVELPPGTLRQDTISDARLSPLRVRAGWFEGPIHDVIVSDFRSTHSTRSRGRVYGRFVGRVEASFEMPEKPLPPRAEALLAEFTAPEEPESALPPAPPEGASAKPAAPEGASSPEAEGVSAEEPAKVESPAAEEATPAPKKLLESQVPLFSLVAAVAIAIFALCSVSRAVIWLVFLLPTLLLRRILRGALPDSRGVRVVSVMMVLGQLGCVGALGGSWWAHGCKEMAILPVIGLVFGVFAASALPSNLPLLISGAALGLSLGAWCSAFGKRCQEAPDQARSAGRPSVDDPGVPRTNPDGSWPRRPPRDLPATAKDTP